jgi:predicted ATPase
MIGTKLSHRNVGRAAKAPVAILCEYVLGEGFHAMVETDLGKGVLLSEVITISTDYKNSRLISGLSVDMKKFCQAQGLTGKELQGQLIEASDYEDLESIAEPIEDEEQKHLLLGLKRFYENSKSNWSNPIEEYVWRIYIAPQLPKFLYYDEYYSLPSRVDIEALKGKNTAEEHEKTAQALVELAGINLDDIVSDNDFEAFVAELEATENNISAELFKYWTTNKNLSIQFKVDKQVEERSGGQRPIVHRILDIRVRNNRAQMSLPLDKRSKGFNWFFSFLVWFNKIQEDRRSNYVLLLDEPGINLHAAAQADLLKFIEDLSEDYQVIYTTHSPFMVDSDALHRVRTIVESKDGSVISDTLEERDPKTLFPLQAALGYDIAQNLFVSKNNLIVEGVSDLIYLQVMSGLLEKKKKSSLRDDITIVPVGGFDKVSTFISLLGATKLNLACLIDASIDRGSKQRIENIVREKLIKQSKIIYCSDALDDVDEADIEDLFMKNEYLDLFNRSHPERDDVSIDDLNADIRRIVVQINQHYGIDRFNHLRPAHHLVSTGADEDTFSEDTYLRFEKLFTKINSTFS